MSLSSVPVAVLIFYVIKAFELPLAEELGILDKEEERKSDTCLHGGHRADATCFCSPNWAGKRCETPRCQNEGLISGSNCLCPERFTGRFCQTPICSQKNVDDRSDSGKRTFAIVLEKTKANKRAIHSVADNIREIMEGVTRGNHTWFERYVLLRITKDSAFMRKRGTTIPEEFQEMVEHFARHSNKLTNQTGCEAPMFGGVLNALSDLEDGAPESMVWIVSSSAPNDYKIRKKPLLRRIAITRAKVYHILTNSTKCKMNLYNEGVNLLRELIVSGGGNQFIVKSKDVGKFMASYIPTLRSSKLISSVPCNNTSTICDVPLTTGGAISKLYITNDNQYGKVDLYDTKGERAPSDEIYNDGRNEITAVEVHETNYVLRINSSVRHHVQVHGTSPIGVTSAFLVNRFGRINLSDDNITHIPYTEENNTVVFHVIGNETDTLLKSVTLHDSQNGNDTTFDLFTRENCTFEYFSGPITCGSNNQVMTVFGLDSEGKPFHRYGGLMCCDLV